MLLRVAKSVNSKARDRGSIERRGNSLRVKVYAGVDPMTGKRLYLTESTTDEKEAQRILNRSLVQVDKQRSARTKATLRVALADWLRFLEIEESTRRSYEGYIRNHIDPLLGGVPVSKITARVLEEFYAELRRCRKHCDGKPAVDHRVDGPHECRTVKHKRPPGRPPAGRRREHDCAKAGCVVQECAQHVCVPLSPSTVSKIHHLIGGTLDAAVRWEWIDTNPADVARRPRQPAPQPDPPKAEQVVRRSAPCQAEPGLIGKVETFFLLPAIDCPVLPGPHLAPDVQGAPSRRVPVHGRGRPARPAHRRSAHRRHVRGTRHA